MQLRLALRAAALVLACAACATPPAPSPGTFTAWGYVRLVPPDGVAPGAGAYGDRRLRDAVLVDYSRPGFVVVHAEGPAPAGGRAEMWIASGPGRAHFDPAQLAMGAGDALVVTNRTDGPQLVSSPEAGVLERVAPGASLEIAPPGPGPFSVFLLGAAGAEARVFAAPGPYAVVSSSGRFELVGLAAGHRTLRAWHPRFPAVERPVEAVAGALTRLDIEMGVQRGDAPPEPGRAQR